MTPLLPLVVLVAFLAGGIAVAAIADAALAAAAAGRPVGRAVAGPFARALAAFRAERTTTEAPDALLWALAPALYLALAAVGMSVVPLHDGPAVTATEAGVVLWGTCEALTVVAVFLHGWAPNSPLPLIGAYRYVAIGLPAMLVSMFVLIAVALPARSLSVTAIVEAQEGMPNLVAQPLGLPLFLVLGLSLTLRGPFDYADPADLSGGTSAEDSPPRRAVWQLARLAMLVSFAAMASAAFLGGPLGPVLPGWLWMALKMTSVGLVVILLDVVLARIPVERMMRRIWTLLLPLAFLDLGLAGGLLLW